MVPRGRRRERESRKGRITIGRRVGKIGFLGKGVGVPSREKADVAHALGLRIDEDLIAESELQRDRCRDDAMPRSGLLRRVFSRRPKAVVFPDSGQCVADILDVCIEERTPAVPRGLGSRGLGGAVPVKGGVVIDLSRMNRVISVDKENHKVTVEAGCTWQKLREEIAPAGLSLRSYPGNVSGSTVGGWISSGGYGIGTLADGRFETKVESMEVAVPSGLLVRAAHGEGRYSLESFAGTEGQLGIITELTFSVKPQPGRSMHYVLTAGGIADAVETVKGLASMDHVPLGIRLLSGAFPRHLGEQDSSAQWTGPVVAILFEGDEGEVADFEEHLKGLAGRSGLKVAVGEGARSAFETGFAEAAYGLDRKVVLCGEVVVGLDRLEALIGLLKAPSDGRILVDTQVVDRGLALVSACYLVDEPGSPIVMRDVPATVRLSQASVRCGGRPYGIGIWNGPFANSILGKRRKSLQVIKSETDRLRTLNPGKFFSMTTSSGLPVWNWTYKIGLGMIEIL